MKKYMIAVLAVGLVLGTVGCADVDSRTKRAETNVSEIVYEHSDGRKVPCLMYTSGHQAGLSCDWSNAK